jgi:hypothetical protein
MITTAPILFKFGMMHLRDKRGINCDIQVSCPFPPWGLWGGAKSIKIDKFLKNLLL